MRRISPGTVTVGVVAILIGLVAANVAHHYLKAEPAKPAEAKPKVPMATFVIPKVNLPKYVRIREQDLQRVECPAEKLPAGVVSPARALDRLVKTTILANEPVREESLYPVGEVPLLADNLPPGKRAVTITIDANDALNGMLQPQSRVDIALTVDEKHPELKGLATLTLARNIQVLATSVTRFPGTEDRPSNVRNITVAASPEEANRLILAQRYGNLSLTLRGPEDAAAPAAAEATAPEGNDLVNTRDLLGLKPVEPPAAPEPEPMPVQRKVEVWRGESRQEIIFGVAHIQEAEDATATAEGREAVEISPYEPANAVKKKECKECEQKKAAKKAEAQQAEQNASQPTLAPPAPVDQRLSALTPRSERQVIEVRVEAQPARVVQ